MSDALERLHAALGGRYTIERELGEGGMATVYLAKDLKHNREVALKVLKPELAAVVGAERFLAEIEVTANLTHPHILPLHDSGEADSFLFDVMPYVQGESLRERIDREKQLGVDDALAITQKVAGALDYAHGHGVVHRDIKPGNILLSEQGEPLVADFGIALAVAQAGAGRITETGLSLGTPHYMSPEQATGDRDVDPRSDVYALGCVLYEMLSGDPPFLASTAQAVLVKILTSDAPPITTVRGTVPHNIEAALSRALEKLPADRFGTTAQFSEALADDHCEHTTRPAPPYVGSGSDTAQKSTARPVSVPFTVVGVVAIFALVAAAWGWLRPTTKTVSRYSISLPAGRSLSDQFGSHIAIAPDGSSFVFAAASAGTGSRIQLWMKRLDQLEATVLPGTQGARNPTYSPDGERLSFTAPAVKVLSLAGGSPITVAESDGDIRLLSTTGSLSWGPDGYIYAVSLDGLVRFRADGGPIEQVTIVDTAKGERAHLLPHTLPNGLGVLFTVAYLSGGINRFIDSDVALVDLESGEHEILFRGVKPLYAQTGHILSLTVDGTLLATPFDADRLQMLGRGVTLQSGIGVRTNGRTDLVLSSSGTLMYTTRTDSSTTALVWVERDGSEREIDPGWTGSFGSVSLSPDETRLAVDAGVDANAIWIRNLERGTLRRLTFDGTQNQRPAWTPDGLGVLFSSDREADGEIWLQLVNGGRGDLILKAERRIADGFLSHDGEWLIYRTSAAVIGNGDIFAKRIGTDAVPVPLLNTPFGEWAPALSPDGRYLAYVSNRTGVAEVYVRPFPETGALQFVVSNNGGLEPVWARNGRELFYRNGAGEMVAVEVETEPTFVAGQQRVLFDAGGYRLVENYHSYDVTSDGERFVMIRMLGTGENEIIVVENFLDELRERMGN